MSGVGRPSWPHGLVLEVRFPAPECEECGFSSRDVALMNAHDCDVQANGGRCEDWPCCGHEFGDCNGELYGSDESIKAQVQEAWDTGHGYCDHAYGIYQCE